jgi:Ca2+:H+ antiporter
MLSEFIAVMLLLGYLASLLFSVFRVGDKPGDEESDEFDPLLGERSEAAVSRLLAYRHHLARNGRVQSGVLRSIDQTLTAIMKHETAPSTEEQTEPGAEVPAVPAVVLTRQAEVLSRRVPFRQRPVKAPASAEQKSALLPALLLLAAATLGVSWLSDILVGAIEPLTVALHWNASFVGLIFIPLIGGLPEYFNTIGMALEKRMGMVLAASAGSSIQIALLMAPILVLVSLAMPVRLDLTFSVIELAVLAIATFLFSEVTRDGELVWLEGLLLILLYAMMAGTVFLFGA